MKFRTVILSGMVSLFLAGSVSARILKYDSVRNGKSYRETLELNTQTHRFLMEATCIAPTGNVGGGGEFEGNYFEEGNVLILKGPSHPIIHFRKNIIVTVKFEKTLTGYLIELKPFPRFEDIQALQGATCSLGLSGCNFGGPIIFTPQN